MPGARMSIVVAMKFSAPSSEARQNSEMLMIQQRLAPAFAGPRHFAEPAQRGVAGPAADRRAARNHKCRQYRDEGEERHPKREHVQVRKSHVRRADLNRQKIVSEAALRRRREDEEHHDRAVHRQHRRILLRRHDSALNERNVRARPRQVETHDHGKNHSDDDRRHGQQDVLDADHFMIDAEDVLADKARRRVRHDVERANSCMASCRVQRAVET